MTRALQFLLPVVALLLGVCWLFFSWGQQPPASSALKGAPPSSVPPHGTASAELPSFSPSAAPVTPSEADHAGAPISPATAPGNGRRPPIAATRTPSSRPGFTTRQSAARTGMAPPRDPLVISSESPTLTPNANDPSGLASQEAATVSAPPMARGPTYPAVFAHNAAANAAAASSANAANGTSLAGNAAQATSASPPVSQAEQLMLDKINNDFVTAVGGAGQDPNDPAYQLRWDAAQAASDAQYKKFFGGRAYVRRQIEAAQQAAIEQQAAAQP